MRKILFLAAIVALGTLSVNGYCKTREPIFTEHSSIGFTIGNSTESDKKIIIQDYFSKIQLVKISKEIVLKHNVINNDNTPTKVNINFYHDQNDRKPFYTVIVWVE